MAVEGHVRPTYGNWRRPKSPGLFGLGSLGTIIMFIGLVVMVGVVAVGGFLRGAITFLLLVLALATVTVRDQHGRSLLERQMTRVGWRSARMKGAHLYQSGPLGQGLWGTHQPPGIAASLRLSEHRDSYGRPFALIHAPMSNTFAVAIETQPDGGSLVDDEQVDEWVALWGQWLASLADEPSLEAAAVTIETAPDTGSRLRREIRDTRDPSAPRFAREVMDAVSRSAGTGSSSIRGYVTLTFSAASREGGKRRTAAEMGRDLASRLPGLTGDLASTGAGDAVPLSALEVCEIVRTAYDPSVAALIERAHAEGDDTGITWEESGPVAHEAFYDGYAHDDAYSISWSMSTAPRGVVHSAILRRLLEPHPDIDRKRVTLLYRPLDAARAAGIVQADLRAAEFAASTSEKPSSRDLVAVRAAKATADEEAEGAALVNFGMLVTATVMSPYATEDPAEAVAKAASAVDLLSGSARLRLRRVHGAQEAAFAAGLPLGLLLPRLVKIPTEMRERL